MQGSGPSTVIRAFDPAADIVPLLQLLEAVKAADGVGEAVDEAGLREQLAWPEHDPRRDRWVAVAGEQAGHVVGHAFTWRPPMSTRAYVVVVVHPRYRGRGTGRALFKRALGRARALGASGLDSYAAEGHKAAAAFLHAMAFEPAGSYVEMRARPEVAFSAPEWPAGYTAAPYDAVGDPTVLCSALNRCYAGQWGHRDVSLAELAHWLPTWPHAGIFLAFAPDGVVVGTCRVELEEGGMDPHAPRGTVDAPGIVAAYRDRNLRRPLLLVAARWLRARASGWIALRSWGDSPADIAVYHGAGFEEFRREIGYQRGVD